MDTREILVVTPASNPIDPDYEESEKRLKNRLLLNPSKVVVISNSSILAAVGQKMASTLGVSATLFNALATISSIRLYSSHANINIQDIAQGYSEYNTL
ncbi:hypothetical protein L6452_06717 [Arctium lappa]|uniref:Uncharacterized protein n=1 Tax=Arctium lappa TaxID=4217 RepID=A0ACB9EJX7_ARCLA|nr:hypothetical protein L6452_06717 [Arctium lappa]